MTEDQAKEKWCPFVRFAMHGEDGQAANRADPVPESAPWNKCIASACMAWRKQRVMIDRATNLPAVPGETPIGQLEERYSEHGFCGLAGQP